MRTASVAIPTALEQELRLHLLRDDGQEDACIAFYKPSDGENRQTALLTSCWLPETGDREVHGNVTLNGDYIVRCAEQAREEKSGIVLMHSHPAGRGWQAMSSADSDTESRFSNIVKAITGLPFWGMTLAGGDNVWSARAWDRGAGRRVSPTWCENVRIVGKQLRSHWNGDLVPIPRTTAKQMRTVSAWGADTQANISRLKILVVGAGSVGMDVALRFARAGFADISVMDHDIVKEHNLDRLAGATMRDVGLKRSKAYVAERELKAAATARKPRIAASDLSVCEPEGFRKALDADLIFSCVDRPWPRMILNGIAYNDLIPVIDGGLFIGTGARGMLRATWKSHVVRHGYPCLVCLDQLVPSLAALERDGSLDSPSYISNAPHLDPDRDAQSVSLVSVSVVSALLMQFIEFCVLPDAKNFREVMPLRFSVNTAYSMELEHLSPDIQSCHYHPPILGNDRQTDWTYPHPAAENMRQYSKNVSAKTKMFRCLDERLSRFLRRYTSHRPHPQALD